jgi:hypothetical protein
MYLKLPLVDRPMIAGRLKATILASRTAAPSAVTLRIKACAESAAAGRSANDFNRATRAMARCHRRP